MTTIAAAVYIYRSDAKPLGAVDSWRLANLLRNGAGKAELVRVRPHALQRAEILLRRGSSDAGIAVQTLVHGLHVPPTPSRAPEVVWDLGANIGLTVAHYACLYPAARIVGVEPDPENAALAVRNIDSWRGRCRISQCAVCAEDGEVGFELDPGHELAGRVVELEEGNPRHRRV